MDRPLGHVVRDEHPTLPLLDHRNPQVPSVRDAPRGVVGFKAPGTSVGNRDGVPEARSATIADVI